MNTLPEAFLHRMRSLLGEEYEAFLNEYEKEPTRALYCTSRLDAETFESNVDFPVKRIPHLENGYTFDYARIGTHPFHHAGVFYVQDPSAMATVCGAPVTPGMKCLDLCASPGGKSVQLASLIGSDGFLVSNEINPSRCKTLCGNIERMGFANVQVTNADVKRIEAWYPEFFDLVLVDAPCSGEGMFRKYDSARAEWTEQTPRFCALRQKELLDHACNTVSPGGYLLYSTCTFSLEENEDTVRAFLETHPTFAVRPLNERLQSVATGGIGIADALRLYPHKDCGEGQFICLMQKEKTGLPRLEGTFADARRLPDRTEWEAVRAFLEETVPADGDLNLCALGGHMVAESRPVPKENLFSSGITLGTVEKRRLIPHHQLFKTLGTRFYRKLELPLSDPRLAQYLTGACIPCDLEDGWAVVTTCGVPVGGIKVVSGQAKNHYPKGLRNY